MKNDDRGKSTVSYDIDFLPPQYRQRSARRYGRYGRIGAVVACAAMVLLAALGQHRHRQRLLTELTAMEPLVAQVLNQRQELGRLHAQLSTVNALAELYTYLHHPWPRSQLLMAVVAPLPEGVRFEQLHVARELFRTTSLSGEMRHKPERPREEEIAKLSPAERDLKRLREELDKTRTVIRIWGTTSDVSTLHEYLGTLAKNELFFKVDLESLEAAERTDGLAKFRALLVVRPGYGQPDGPTAPAPAPHQTDKLTWYHHHPPTSLSFKSFKRR
jgi:hypothetical protein